MFYFGCGRETGHYLWAPGLRWATWDRSVHERMGHPLGAHPWKDSIDVRLCPVDDNRGYRRSDEERQPEGLGKIHHRDGWTAWAFWDRTKEKRLNGNSVFLAEGEYDFDAMKAMAQEHFPEIWERIKHLDLRLESVE